MRRTIRIALAPAAMLAGALLCGLVPRTMRAQAQVNANAPRTVRDGVFTAAQAARGEAQFSANCAKCHEGADVDGPPLTGDPFLDRWREDTLESLFGFIKARMPQDAPGKLEASAYLDVLSYLLKANSIPAGARELTTDALGGTLLVGKDGPKPLPANALVKAIGCLAQDADHAWTLTRASELARTRNADEMTAEELMDAAGKALGTQTFGLQNLADLGPAFSAEANQGHKVLIKGVLIRRANNVIRINVTSAGSIAASCAP
jgi:cytochrome c5